MGLSQTLLATSFFKMIDIWMLFTMIVPFFEVIYHTTIEMFKKSRAAPPCLCKRVDVVNVKPAEEDSVVVEEVKSGNNTLNSFGCLMLPVSSLIFVFVFWTVGLIASYSDGNRTDPTMTECLAIQPN